MIRLQEGDYIDLTDMILEEKQAVADYLSQNHEWMYHGSMCELVKYIYMSDALNRDGGHPNPTYRNNRTQEVLDAMNNPIKPNTKIKILSPEHSEYVQKLAFEAGFRWVLGECVMHTEAPYLFFEDGFTITYAMYSVTFSNPTRYYKEIFINTPEAKPSFPSFKVKGCDDMSVREWLAENVTEECCGFASILNKHPRSPYLYYCKEDDHLDAPYLYYYREDGHFLYGFGEDYFKRHPLPELILEREIVGYTLVPDPVQTKREELLRKAESVKAELDKINQELEGLK